jgi:threonine aldolase
MARYDFASDNTAPAAPEAMEALMRFNTGYTSGYGSDHITAMAADKLRELLDADAEVRFMVTGTAANATALAALAQPFEAVLCHEHAHIVTDEAGAPGFFGHGLGLIGLPGRSAQIDPHALAGALAAPEDSHIQSPGVISLTNSTEYGTVYSSQAMGGLIGAAKARGLKAHLDGARLANAAAAGFDLKQIARLGVDVAVVGGSKAGLPMSEALVIFDKSLTRRLDSRLKQMGHLPSKGRFLAAPWIGMLESGAWLEGPRRANEMAKRLAALMPFEIVHEVETCAVFVRMDDRALQRLNAKGWAVYRFSDGTVRFMCSWATTPELVDELGADLKAIV